jgi:lipopolysaccharide transport system ATP-binding protein
MGAIERLCDKTIFLDKGSISFIGETNNAIQVYEKSSDNEDTEFGIKKNSKAFIKSFSKIENNTNNYRDNIFKLEVENSATINAQLAIGINDNLGHRLTTLFSKFYTNFELKPGKHIITCQTTGLNLKPGKYTISLFLGDSYGVYDYMENITNFQINQYEFYPSGEMPDNSQGSILVNQNWNLLDN